METIKMIVVASLLLLVSFGCGNEELIPEGQFVIGVETIAEGDDLAITLLKLSFRGKHSISVYEMNDTETIWVEPNKDTNISTCEVLLLADKTGMSNCQSIKWLHQLRARGVIAGGPAIYPLSEDTPLQNLLSITIQPGEYPMSGEIDLATFKDNRVHLKFDKQDNM